MRSKKVTLNQSNTFEYDANQCLEWKETILKNPKPITNQLRLKACLNAKLHLGYMFSFKKILDMEHNILQKSGNQASAYLCKWHEHILLYKPYRDSKTHSNDTENMRLLQEKLANPNILKVLKEVVCQSCGSKNTRQLLKQTRSADEGETEYVECLSCGHKTKCE